VARLARSEIPNGWYHVINRGRQRKAIFRDRYRYEDFLKRLGQFPERFGLRIRTYVLMPNHDHLQLELGSRLSLSAAMHWLNTGYGIWLTGVTDGKERCFRDDTKLSCLIPMSVCSLFTIIFI
jgi:REP element-mobilizing transposase RayT